MRATLSFGVAVLCVVLSALPGHAQTTAASDQSAPPAAGVVATAEPAGPPATLVYANRAIVVFRATLLLRTPAERAAAATQFLDRLVDEAPRARVTTQGTSGSVVVKIGDRVVFVIHPADVNTLAGETIDRTVADAAAHLQQAFDEAVELRNPVRLLRSALLALAATVLFLGVLWILRWIHRVGIGQLERQTERQLEKRPAGAAIVRATHVPEFLQRGVHLIGVLLALFVTYTWITFVLRRFPYTRPWGESLRTAFLASGFALGQRILASLPDLLTVLIIVTGTRIVVRMSNALFAAVGEGRVSVPWIYPETAQPTRRLVAALLWLLAIVVAYPYLPGSESDAFKGVSVFVGLMISIGSSGIMNQVMSGMTITYSRAVRIGDFVKIGDVEGTVEQLGVLSTKIKTERGEEVTIPNTLVVSTSTTNYSLNAEREGVRVPTSVTIGYDTPWRQVHALLIMAAERTPGVRREPRPIVHQTGLLDFYVQYTLLVCLEHPHLRVPTLGALHANILDAFNEYGVQITSPNYEADPAGPKIVPRDLWYAAPADPARDSVTATAAVSPLTTSPR